MSEGLGTSYLSKPNEHAISTYVFMYGINQTSAPRSRSYLQTTYVHRISKKLQLKP